MSDDTVYLSSKAGRRRYHTDLDCKYLEQIETVYTKDRELVESHLSLCQCCSGEISPSGSSDRSHLVALKDANPEDVGLSPMLSD